MLVVCLPLLVALLVGLPSTVPAQTQDHLRLDISGALGTNLESLVDNHGKHLSQHPYNYDDVSPMTGELRISNLLSPKKDICKIFSAFDSKDDRETHLLFPAKPGQVLRSYHLKVSEDADKSSSHCPDSTVIAPCVCYNITETDEPNLDCAGVSSLDQLAGVFRQDFPVKEFNLFRIYNNENIQYLTDIFNGVSFRQINLYNVPNLTEISQYAFFDSVNSLEIIYIYNSLLDENTFPFSTLAEFQKLTSLTLVSSNMNVWPSICQFINKEY